mgnify:CR=1 FL=1|tara:strand:+ start:1751 stop:2179 length:429 start_codon:yes stop_codon:yes gene_type:complete
MTNSDDAKKKTTTDNPLKVSERFIEQTLDLPRLLKDYRKKTRRLLSTDELHGFGFVSTMRMMPSPSNPDQVVSVYPREVQRGDEVILVPPDHDYDDPMELFIDGVLRRGRLVGVHNEQLHVCMHDEDIEFDDLCFMIDNPCN